MAGARECSGGGHPWDAFTGVAEGVGSGSVAATLMEITADRKNECADIMAVKREEGRAVATTEEDEDLELLLDNGQGKDVFCCTNVHQRARRRRARRSSGQMSTCRRRAEGEQGGDSVGRKSSITWKLENEDAVADRAEGTLAEGTACAGGPLRRQGSMDGLQPGSTGSCSRSSYTQQSREEQSSNADISWLSKTPERHSTQQRKW